MSVIEKWIRQKIDSERPQGSGSSATIVSHDPVPSMTCTPLFGPTAFLLDNIVVNQSDSSLAFLKNEISLEGTIDTYRFNGSLADLNNGFNNQSYTYNSSFLERCEKIDTIPIKIVGTIDNLGFISKLGVARYGLKSKGQNNEYVLYQIGDNYRAKYVDDDVVMFIGGATLSSSKVIDSVSIDGVSIVALDQLAYAVETIESAGMEELMEEVMG